MAAARRLTPLLFASRDGKVASAKALLEPAAEINLVDPVATRR